MTTPHPVHVPRLRTDADLLARVERLVGRATADRRLWIVLDDGDGGAEPPVLVPVTDLPLRPGPAVLRAVTAVLTGLCAGTGRVVLTLERAGPDRVLPADHDWARALAGACRHAGVRLRGVYLSSSGGVRRMLPG